MTLSLQATVYNVEVDPDGNSVIALKAIDGQNVTIRGGYHNAPEYVVPQISSNTEGKVLTAVIVLTIEGSEPPLEVGQTVYFGGAFSKKTPPEQTDIATLYAGTTEGTPANPGSPLDGTAH